MTTEPSQHAVFTAIVRFSLRFRGIVIGLAAIVVGYGIYSLTGARYDVFPEFAAKVIEIQTEAPGLSPEQVELLVTTPIEHALNGTEGLVSIRSSSLQGLSLIDMVFEEKGDVYHDRQVVAERLAGIAQSLPAGVGAPIMTPLTSSTGVLMAIGLRSDHMSITKLRTLVEWTVKPRLLSVPGVAKIGVFGGTVREIRVEIKPDALVRYGLSIGDVVDAATKATGVVGGGFVDTSNQRIVLRTEGQATTAKEIGETIVRHDRLGNVRLKDVANVVDSFRPPISAGSMMGKPAVVLDVWAQYGARTLETTERVDGALRDLRPLLKSEGVVMDPTLFRAASFINTATHNIQMSLFLGGILVIVVLFLFLGHFRSALISCTAIPLSLLTAVIVLQKLGFTLNTMTLGGLAIAIGEVVDDAVIDLENILRRLREAGPGLSPRERMKVVLGASIEVRGAVVYATLAVGLVFVPILTMTGLAGRLFSPMAVAYILSILASLAVASTVTPALSLMLSANPEKMDEPQRFVVALQKGYTRFLEKVQARERLVLMGVVTLTILAAAAIPLLPTQFIPPLHEAHYIGHLEMAPGTSIAESYRIGEIATRKLLALPIVRTVAQRVGRAEADEARGPQSSELEIDLHPLSGKEAAKAASQIENVLDTIPGVSAEVNTFLTERINETISGHTAAVVVNVFSNDLDSLDESSAKVAAALRGIRGVADVRVVSPPGLPMVSIRLREDQLSRWGIDRVTALEAIRTAYQGDVVGQIFEGTRVTNVTVAIDEATRHSVAKIGDLPLRSARGTFVLLRNVADIAMTSGRYEVDHESAKRVEPITCNVRGRSTSDFVAVARAAIDKLGLPAGTYVEFGGSAQEEAKSRRDLVIHSLVVAVGIAMLLMVVLGSPRNLLLIAVNLPFALAGGIAALVLTRHPLSIGATVGFVTLFGITLRNSIMMLTHFDHLIRQEGQQWGVATAIRGAKERLLPILMTSIVTGLGLLPLALASGSPGREIEGPMAIVILGGLITSTALNLLVLPTLSLRFGRFGADKD